MPPPINKNLAAFQQLAKKAAVVPSSNEIHAALDVQPLHNSPSATGGHKRVASAKNRNFNASGTNVSHSHTEFGGSFGSQDDLSSGEGSDSEMHRGGDNRKGLVYQKTENMITKIRDLIAQSDVFVVRGESPPFIACLQISVWFIPILFVALLWDTLAATAFEIPHLSWIDHPGFLLGWHFVMVTLAMYGFMLSYLSSGLSPRTSLALISLGIHYLLLFYRIFMEVFFDGFRGQSKVYIEKPTFN